MTIKAKCDCCGNMKDINETELLKVGEFDGAVCTPCKPIVIKNEEETANERTRSSKTN